MYNVYLKVYFAKGSIESVKTYDEGRYTMRRLSSWLILTGVFLFACEGLNLVRDNLEYWIAYGHFKNMLICILGLCMTLLGTAFLGGFVYFRDKKRNKLKKRVPV